jgi:UDP-sugar transporter A1/2/3
MLDRRLSNTKWTALAILTIGIALVVLPKNAFYQLLGWEQVLTEQEMNKIGNQSNAKGLISVLAACILSGIAGVYFEKVVKTVIPHKDDAKEHKMDHFLYDSEQAFKIQLWIRNIQLSFFSVVLGGVFVVGLQDGTNIWKDGFFQNYSIMTWVVIFIQAGGGLIVGLVVRYADNILKGFATSISIILSSIVSYWLFQFEVSITFGLGALLVVYATYTYGSST